MGTIQDLIPDLTAPYQFQPSDLPMTLPGLERGISDLSLGIMLMTLEAGQDQSTSALRQLLENLASFRQDQERLYTLLEQAPTDASSCLLWQQMRELDILLRAYEHQVRLVQSRFQQGSMASHIESAA